MNPSPLWLFVMSLISLCLVYIGAVSLPTDMDLSVQIMAGVALGANAYLAAWHGAVWLTRGKS